VPKLWNETIESHRREVRDAILDTTAALVAEHGLLSVTMSQIAEKTGIGRATLYKYFPDVESILFAWHERQITGHLEYLAEVRDQAGSAGDRLEAVLEAYALISHESHGHHNAELAAFLHRDEQVGRPQQQLRDMIRDLLTEGAETGDLRDDVAPDELASYCLHALAAASSLPSKAAVRRLVTVILAGLHPSAARAAQVAAPQESRQGPGAGGVDRHGHRSGAADRHARRSHDGQRTRPTVAPAEPDDENL
jgi:AcrR family transcriptional regulator